MIDTEPALLTPKLMALANYGHVNARLFDLLLTRFGSVEEIMLLEKEDLAKIDGLSPDRISRIVDSHAQVATAEKLLATLTSREIQVVNRFEPAYPDILNELHDPPTLLYVRGKLPQADAKRVAIAGSEVADAVGIGLAAELAKKFIAQQVAIIAGLHNAIDTAVHLASIAASGKSYAVVSPGFDQVTDTELMPVAIDLALTGGLISESPPSRKESATDYVASNRLIASLSHAVIFCDLDQNSPRLLDLVDVCGEIGKLAFFFIDPARGALADESSMERAIENGVIIIEGFEKLPDIVRSLV